MLSIAPLTFQNCVSLQCRCGPDRLLHRHRHHAGHGGERGCGGHLQLREGAAFTTGQHGPDRGTVNLVPQCPEQSRACPQRLMSKRKSEDSARQAVAI